MTREPRPADRGLPAWKNRGAFQGKIRQWFWDEKLNNVPGAVFLALLTGLLGWLTVDNGVVAGLLVIAACVAIPVVYAIVAYPRFGIALLLGVVYLLFYIMRLGINFPLGTLIDGMLALLVLGFFISQKKRPDWAIYRNPVSVVILVWLLYNLLQVANPWAESRMAWLYTVRTTGTIVLIYFIFLYQVDSFRYLRFLIGYWLALATVGALYAYRQEYFGFAGTEFENMVADPLMASLLFIDGHWRKYSVFSDPVAFSYNMVIAFFVCLSLLTARGAFSRKVIIGGVGLLCVSSMFFAGTRGAYVLIPAGLVLFTLLRFQKKLIPFAVAAGFLLGVMIFIPTSNPTLYRFQTAFKPSIDASYSVRAANQKRIQPYLQSHPFGGGLGATGAWGVRFAPHSYLAGFPPDSGFMRTAAELGWVGLMLQCLMIFLILKTGIDNYYKIRNDKLKTCCLAMTLVVFVLCVGNFPQEAFVQFPANILFYLAAAIIQVTYRLDTRLDFTANSLPPANKTRQK
ncbi:hypothetical protein GCM10023091_32710 [Ravibacter arvi]|uniref:O-antigen ligase-related domain-containing protein n=1 Tax=Ravibacter arvi TaxID=2051041 RepID=A0ABP8M3B9_9BACT